MHQTRWRPPGRHVTLEAAPAPAERHLNGTRRLFAALALAATIPVILFGVWMAFVTATEQRALARASAERTVEQVARRIEAEVRQEVEVADALALSSALDAPDLTSFYEEAGRLVGGRPRWEAISLATPDGVQMLKALRPYAGRPVAVDDNESFRAAVDTRKVVVGRIGPSGLDNAQPLVPLRVPVLRQDKLVYILTVGLRPDKISEVLREAGAPPGWVGAVADAKGNLVARTHASDIHVGRPANPTLRDAIAVNQGGSYRGKTLEGVESEVVFRTLEGTNGWTVHFGIPSAALDSPVHRSVGLLFGGGAASIALAIGLGLLMAREVAQRREDEAYASALALQESERRRILAVEAAQLGTWRWDLIGHRIEGSGRFATLLGLPPSTAADGRWPLEAILDRLRVDDRSALHDFGSRCVETGETCTAEFRTDDPLQMLWLRVLGRAEGQTEAERTVVQGVIADISLQKHAERDRAELLRRLAGTQEAERRRIARELHDQVGQTVTGLSLALKSMEALPEATAQGALREHVIRLQELAGQIGRDIHQAASDLRPSALDDLGLFHFLEAYVSEWSQRYGIAADLQVIGNAGRLTADVETALFRAVQEALTNVLKHADATSVSLVLERRHDRVHMVVEDNGRGFDVDGVLGNGQARSNGLGLSGMRERLTLVGGVVTLESAPGKGTSIFIQVPVQVSETR